MADVAFRDAVRFAVLGVVRKNLLEPYRKLSRQRRARVAAATDPNRFECPVCGYSGIFVDHVLKPSGKVRRRYAFCVSCGAAERHRLQSLVVDELLSAAPPPKGASVLHFAPEAFMSRRLAAAFSDYKTADLFRGDVDIKADIIDLPIPDAQFDWVYASHVLEHVPDDRRAIREIHRVLKPGGVAVLPVPIHSIGDLSAEKTEEYGVARPEEDGHVRAPGLDYFDRYREVFDTVEVYESERFGARADTHQLYIRPVDLESGAELPRLPDFVPVCRKRAAG